MTAVRGGERGGGPVAGDRCQSGRQSVYDLGITPSSTTPTHAGDRQQCTLINSAADAATHGGFDALVWVPNPSASRSI
jgi:hypothetical protein